jgi:signal transduction histidine kinase
MFKSLFWKVFLTIWLSNIAIGMSSAFSIAYLVEQEEFRQKIRSLATPQANKVINAFETNRQRLPISELQYRALNGKTSEPGTDKNANTPEPTTEVLVMNVQHPEAGIIYGPESLEAADSLEWFITAKSSTSYRIRTLIPDNQSHQQLTAHFRHINISLMLGITGLASLLLSLALTRPLKKLTLFTQRLGKGELEARLDDAMLDRVDEIGGLSKALNRMAIEIQQLLNNKHRLLHDVSHELRAPLARLQVATELALGTPGIHGENSPETDKQQRYANRIHQEVDTLEAMIDEILELARLDQLETHLSTTALKQLIEDCLDDAAFSQPQRHFVCDLSSQHHVIADAHLLKRTLSNVLGNALKHTPQEADIELTTRRNGKQVIITVRDHGEGINPQLIDDIFQPFKRLSNKSSGYGLGLTIAKRAIEAQGGQIMAYNHKQGGLAFDISLPAAPEHSS